MTPGGVSGGALDQVMCSITSGAVARNWSCSVVAGADVPEAVCGYAGGHPQPGDGGCGVVQEDGDVVVIARWQAAAMVPRLIGSRHEPRPGTVTASRSSSSCADVLGSP